MGGGRPLLSTWLTTISESSSSFGGDFLADSSVLRTRRYVAVKIMTAHQTILTDRGYFAETSILKKVSTANPIYPGFQHVTPLLHNFEVESVKGRHLCLCTEVLGTNLQVLRGDQPNRRFSLPTTKHIVKQILSALDYLHTRCEIIHTGES